MPALLEDYSPHGNAIAVVEQDERVAFFYLKLAGKDDRMRACWVRNVGPAPAGVDVEAMREGRAPMMPAGHCAHPGGAAPLVREDLRVVWSEEGDGVALYERESLLAVIPSWSGMGDFYGYARDARGEGPVAWELGAENDAHRRFAAAARFWAAWGDPDYWVRWRDPLLMRVERALGKHTRYLAIDGGEWPPRALVVIPQGRYQLMVTLGMALRPQPAVELMTEAPEKLRRIELGMCLAAALPDDSLRRAASWLSGQPGLPWSENTWLGPGHTMPSHVYGELSGGRFPWALF